MCIGMRKNRFEYGARAFLAAIKGHNVAPVSAPARRVCVSLLQTVHSIADEKTNRATHPREMVNESARAQNCTGVFSFGFVINYSNHRTLSRGEHVHVRTTCSAIRRVGRTHARTRTQRTIIKHIRPANAGVYSSEF